MVTMAAALSARAGGLVIGPVFAIVPALIGRLPSGSPPRRTLALAEARERVGRGRLGHLALARGPGREREAHEERRRDLGLQHDHGAGLEDPGPAAAGGGQEAVLGALGLGRRRAGPPPAARRSTRCGPRPRLAVCCAPTSTMPRLRPRSEMSRSTSLIGPLPSRGAYLLSSSSTTKTSGRAVPSALLLLEHALEDRAHHEALGPVVERVDVHDAHLLALSSRARDRRACRRPCRGSGARRAARPRAAAARRRPPSPRPRAAPTARPGSRPAVRRGRSAPRPARRTSSIRRPSISIQGSFGVALLGRGRRRASPRSGPPRS